MITKKWALIGAAAVLAAGAIGMGAAIFSSKQARPGPHEPSANTAVVEKRELSARISEDGTLTYAAGPDGSPYSVINRATGTYTELPELGQVISQGQVLYRVDDNPVVLLNGTSPVFRTLSIGITGADVAELNADLLALGDASTSEIPDGSDTFTYGTARGVEKLQATLGVAQDGVLSLGQAIFLPGALRVSGVPGLLGGTAQSGQVVAQGTSTTRMVTINLDAAQQSLLKAGDPVSIKLPDGRKTPGAVSSVGTVATVPTSGPGGSNNAAPTITVLVSPTDPEATGAWDRAPVNVTITTGSATSALVVPVDALLAQAGGRYAVEVVGADGVHRLVPVALGLFDDADGLVQVSGPRLAAGQRVVVPVL